MVLFFGEDLNKYRSSRSAICPYIVIYDDKIKEHKLLFLFGVHDKTKEITDFGGGVKSFESDLTGGIREFNEETCGLFDISFIESVKLFSDCLSVRISDMNMSVIFVPIDGRWITTANKQFLEKRGLLEIKYTQQKKNIETKIDSLNVLGELNVHEPIKKDLKKMLNKKNDDIMSIMELSGVVWIDEIKFCSMIREECKKIVMWKRLSKFYYRSFNLGLKNALINQWHNLPKL